MSATNRRKIQRRAYAEEDFSGEGVCQSEEERVRIDFCPQVEGFGVGVFQALERRYLFCCWFWLVSKRMR